MLSTSIRISLFLVLNGKFHHRDTEKNNNKKIKKQIPEIQGNNRMGRGAFGGRIRIYFSILPPEAILPILLFHFLFSRYLFVSVVKNCSFGVPASIFLTYRRQVVYFQILFA
jgi:hypothetical protein